MAELVTPPKARAWVYCGDWVADCPRGCNNVEFLFDLAVPGNPRSARTVRKTGFYCSYCHWVGDIEWAKDEAGITEVLARRPIPHTRNWWPPDHPLPVQSGRPHGQSVADLIDENHEYGVA